MQALEPLVARCLPEIVALRHDLHAEPELSFKETNTARRVAGMLEKLPGMTLRKQVAGTGIVAVLGAEKRGPCVALRADMDALPIQEATGVPYASKHPGHAHACGHDGHVACLVGAATVLAQLAGRLSGPVKFIFQPAEEGGGGGRLMCEQGALEHPSVRAIFALHAWPHLPLGTIGVRSGPAMASTDAIDIVVQGRGTHAAAPNKGVDPILVAAHIVTALQTVVSRQLPPAEPAVVTIGCIQGGTARNIIPEQVRLGGTIRTLTDASRTAAAAAVRRISEQTALAHGARAEVQITPGYPVLVNHAAAADYIRRTALSELGPQAFSDDLPVSLGGEDFAYYAQRIPAALWRLGIGAPGDPHPEPLHSPRFDFPDAALAIGIRMEVALALGDLQAL